ncbi:uncharacterized protein LOC131323509 [Rhododendron vialii]|uniref:uncharacterized protein LOC131323509 n=1 Tax=Rhododendron vialii TaxID=182163 RepID=UPI00265DF50D|nr:uncharacterized protein LOC131323509 [Rhododendron vialii]
MGAQDTYCFQLLLIMYPHLPKKIKVSRTYFEYSIPVSENRNYILYMEEQQKKATATKCPRKLDYNAPFLSTRRPSSANGLRLSRRSSRGSWLDTSNWVPFSWEQIPGKPKALEKCDTLDINVLPPKLPPSRWHPPKVTTKIRNRDQCHVDDDDDKEEDDKGCDGDHDDSGHDVFSDAIDTFSLGESTYCNGLGRVNSEIEETRGALSPSFIIQRFLPDAAALAASSSALAIAKNLNNRLPQSSNSSRGSCVSQPYPSPKSCGLEVFFPWRLKPKPCGLKSPVHQKSIEAKSQWSSRRKKNHRDQEMKEKKEGVVSLYPRYST